MTHYVTRGWTQLKDPHPHFSTAFYLWKNPDVVSARIEPLTHYIEAGSNEFRDPDPRILSPYFASRLSSNKQKDTRHTWLEFILAQGDENTLDFHPAFYIDKMARAKMSPFFDATYYKSHFTDWHEQTDPYVHYSIYGVQNRLSPSRFFDVSYYLSQAAAIDETLDPIIHFLWKGERNGFSPHFYYDPLYYSKAYNGGILEGSFWHFLTKGVVTELWPNQALAGRINRNSANMNLHGYFGEGAMDQCKRILQEDEQRSFSIFMSTTVALVEDQARPGVEAAYREHPGRQPRRVALPNIMLVSHFCGEHMFGSERSFVDMADAISSLPANLTIILPRNIPDYTNLLRAYAVRIIIMPYDWWRKGKPIDESVVTLLANIIQDDAIDLVHTNTLMLREPSLAARRSGLPHVTHVREMVSQDQALCTLIGEDYSEIIKQVKQRSDWIIANSKITSREFLPHDRTFVLYNTVDFEALEAIKHHLNAEKPLRVGLISSNIEKKGVLDFLQLANYSESAGLTAEFHLVGPPTALTQSLDAQRSTLPKNFLFAGYAATPAAAIATLDIVVNFSHFAESFGRTVLEAMAGGRTVICYAWGALTELIDHEETGFLVPYRQPEAALPFLQRLTGDRFLLQKIGKSAQSKAARFRSSAYRESMASIYAKIFEVSGGKPKVAPVVKMARFWTSKSYALVRIAYFCWHFPVPSETFVLAELRCLVESGYDVIVFCKQSPHKTFKPDFDIKFERITTEQHLAERLVETQRSVVHAHFVFPTVTKMVWPACEIAKIPFTFIAHAQDIFVHDNEQQLRLAEICASPFCLRAFTLSRFHYDYMVERGFKREKLNINPNAVDSGRFPMRTQRPFHSARKVVAVHRFVRKKGLDLLIRAASLLEDLDLRIEVYGYGDLEDAYRDLIGSLQLQNVRLMGALPAEKVMDVIGSSDLFASPCVRVENGDMDGIPTSIVESMLAGVPVLTTAIAGIPDLVVDGITGLLCEPNAASVAAGIRRFYTLGEEQIAAMVEEARRRAFRNHDSRRCVDVLTRVWSGRGVDVVIVAWNNLTELRLVVDRILAYTTLPLHLIVCDNHSRKEPVMAFLDEVWKLDDRVTVIENSVNAMVGPGTNLAASQGTNDTIIYMCGKEGIAFANGWELPFVRALEADPKLGLVGTIGYSPSYLTGAQYPKGIRLFESFRNKSFATDHPDRVFGHVQGGLFAFRRKMFDEIGGFSEAVPHDYTDVEYSFYAESRGWKLGQAEGVLALFNKTRPTLSQRFDENVIVAHPVMREQIERFEAVRAGRLKHCNVCDWHGENFSCDGGSHCPDCLASAVDRTLYRWLSESVYMHRRLVALAVGLGKVFSGVWKAQFQGPCLSASEFIELLKQRGRLPNRSGATRLMVCRGLHVSYDFWTLIASEFSRLGTWDCTVLVQSSMVDEKVVACLAEKGFEVAYKFRPVSAAVQFDLSPFWVCRRIEANR